MQFSTFLSKISSFNSDTSNFNSISAQYIMAPGDRKLFDVFNVKNAKQAGVLALFYPNKNGEVTFLLTLRANYKGTHSAQISFPGGKKEITDIDLKATALRETFEEVGVSKEKIKIIKKLHPVYIPPSNFLVTPFIGLLNQKPSFTRNYEVAALIEIKLSELLDENNTTHTRVSTSYMKDVMVPSFKIDKHIIWGATAMILSEIKEILHLKN